MDRWKFKLISTANLTTVCRKSVLTSSVVLLALSVAFLLHADCALATDAHDAPSWLEQGVYPTTDLSDSVRYDIRVHDASRIGMTVTNYGFLGNNFINRSASLEYPLGSTVDHLIRAGLWVGSIDSQGDTLVTTGTVDGYWNTASAGGVEFAPATLGIEQVSALSNSKYYSTGAYSEQDFIAFYSDSFTATSKPTNHVTQGLLVKQRSMVWSYEFADAFVLINFTAKNIGESTLLDMYLGMYGELATGKKSQYQTWPPSGWFNKKDITYYDTLRMVSEHHYTFDSGRATSWGAIKLLGVKVNGDTLDLSTKTTSFNWWGWDPGATDKDEDVERYLLMSNGQITSTAGSEAPAYDAVELLSIGPVAALGIGDSLEVAFAFIGGDDEGNLIANANWAQKAYDFNFVLPTPPPSPLLKVIPGKGKLTLHWDDSPETALDPVTGDQDFEGYRVYLSSDNEDFDTIRQVDIVDTAGFNTGLEQLADPTEIDGTTYKYKLVLDGLKDGFRYWAAVTSYDTGTPDVPSLESGKPQNKILAIPGPEEAEARASKALVFPNPYRVRATWDGEFLRDRYLWFTNLPRKAVIRIYSLAGDLIDEITFDGDTYKAEGARGVYNPGSDPEGRGAPLLSGSMYAWDVISKRDQAVATGLYIFVIEDKTSGPTHGKTETGKFLIIK
ncbi:MAG: hypothetical protein NTX17_11065 [Candidatus Eisenbacteria bacterium]|nr:hypothetical protein [Candidatus Eisenbacteria bacterium]